MSFAPETRVTTRHGHGTVIRDERIPTPGRAPCDRVWVLLDAGANPQWFRGRDLQVAA